MLDKLPHTATCIQKTQTVITVDIVKRIPKRVVRRHHAQAGDVKVNSVGKVAKCAVKSTWLEDCAVLTLEVTLVEAQYASPQDNRLVSMRM